MPKSKYNKNSQICEFVCLCACMRAHIPRHSYASVVGCELWLRLLHSPPFVHFSITALMCVRLINVWTDIETYVEEEIWRRRMQLKFIEPRIYQLGLIYRATKVYEIPLLIFAFKNGLQSFLRFPPSNLSIGRNSEEPVSFLNRNSSKTHS